MAFRLGVDVGGTFTDLFLVGDNGAGTQYRVKTPSTPADPSEGVLVGVRRICEESGVAVGDLRNVLHGKALSEPQQGLSAARFAGRGDSEKRLQVPLLPRGKCERSHRPHHCTRSAVQVWPVGLSKNFWPPT